MRTALLLAAALATGAARSAAQAPTGPQSGAEEAAWLAGCWRATSGALVWDEIWMAPRGGVMVGMGRTTGEGRPTGWEHLLLAPRDGVLTYSALPSGQSLTHFALARRGEGLLRFENPDHDFPQAVEYVRSHPDSVQARVFGDVDDREPAFVLGYARSSCPGA